MADQQVWIPADPEPYRTKYSLRCSCGARFWHWPWLYGRRVAAARERYAQHWHRTHAWDMMFAPGPGPRTDQQVPLARAHQLGYMRGVGGQMLPRCCRSAR